MRARARAHTHTHTHTRARARACARARARTQTRTCTHQRGRQRTQQTGQADLIKGTSVAPSRLCPAHLVVGNFASSLTWTRWPWSPFGPKTWLCVQFLRVQRNSTGTLSGFEERCLCWIQTIHREQCVTNEDVSRLKASTASGHCNLQLVWRRL